MLGSGPLPVPRVSGDKTLRENEFFALFLLDYRFRIPYRQVSPISVFFL